MILHSTIFLVSIRKLALINNYIFTLIQIIFPYKAICGNFKVLKCKSMTPSKM